MATLDPGAVFGGYTIEEQIGQGGMGVVYRATDTRLGRPVALKLLASGGDERFLRESRAAASVDDPHVLPIYEAGEIDGKLFIAMRLVDGEDLRKLLVREGPLEPGRAVSLIQQVAGGLDAVHATGLVHRDIKPSNILLTPGEHVYLTDFGITKLANATGLTKTEAFLGTAEYCAPEVIRGGKIDKRADVYSLGCVLFECLTGRVPFPRDSLAASIYAHLEERPPPMRSLQPGVSEKLEAVVSRALAKDPGDRYQSAGELAADAAAAIGAAAVPARATARRSRPVLGRKRLAVGAAVAGAAAVGAVVVVMLASGGDHATTTGSTTTPKYALRPLVPVNGITLIGSDLAPSRSEAGYCTGDGPGHDCTYLQLTLGTFDQAVPEDGVVTKWSVRNAKGTLSLCVIDGPPGARHVVARSPTVHATPGVDTFKVRIPVKAGQRLGVELGRDGFLQFYYLDEQTTGEHYDPPLGATPQAPIAGADVSRSYELSYNATVNSRPGSR